MPTRRGPRDLVYVKPFLGATINYGFYSGVDSTAQTALGQVKIETSAYPPGFVLGANRPKPPRASRIKSTGTEASYCSADKTTEARAAGWRVTPGKRKFGSTSSRSKTVYVSMGGIKYAWPMPLETYNSLAATRATLGIQDAGNDTTLVYGASRPKPPRVAKRVASQTGSAFSTFSTFCDPSKLDSLPEGWYTTSTGTFDGSESAPTA